MKKSFFFLLVVLAFMPLAAGTIARLPQVTRPLGLVLTNERIYIVDDSSQVHIYNRGPMGILFAGTFGRQGDGPGEFNDIYHVLPRKDHLEVLTFGRLARFSLDGRFLDETSLPIRVFKDGISRIGENYLARDLRYEDSGLLVTIRLYDKDFRKLQELVNHRMPLGDKISLVSDYYSACVVGDHAYVVESGNETRVAVYDQYGGKQREFSLPLEPVRLTPEVREILFRPFREQPEFHSDDESLYDFPEWAPGLDYFDVVDGKCIARTFNYRGDLVEFAIFDLEGRELGRVFLPNLGFLYHGIRFRFFQDRYYYLRKNATDGVWELNEEKAW
jgi:hypothetical protein